MTLTKYIGRLQDHPRIFYQSLTWRMDHILDSKVPLEIREFIENFDKLPSELHRVEYKKSVLKKRNTLIKKQFHKSSI